eukprot:365072-Chlamydomonas_euryale.AAC.11
MLRDQTIILRLRTCRQRQGATSPVYEHPRPLPGRSQAAPRPLPGHSQAAPRPLAGRSQAALKPQAGRRALVERWPTRHSICHCRDSQWVYANQCCQNFGTSA